MGEAQIIFCLAIFFYLKFMQTEPQIDWKEKKDEILASLKGRVKLVGLCLGRQHGEMMDEKGRMMEWGSAISSVVEICYACGFETEKGEKLIKEDMK